MGNDKSEINEIKYLLNENTNQLIEIRNLLTEFRENLLNENTNQIIEIRHLLMEFRENSLNENTNQLIEISNLLVGNRENFSIFNRLNVFNRRLNLLESWRNRLRELQYCAKVMRA